LCDDLVSHGKIGKFVDPCAGPYKTSLFKFMAVPFIYVLVRDSYMSNSRSLKQIYDIATLLPSITMGCRPVLVGRCV
jgi:hypothetical protein